MDAPEVYEPAAGAICGACAEEGPLRSSARPYPFPEWPGGDCFGCRLALPGDNEPGGRRWPTPPVPAPRIPVGDALLWQRAIAQLPTKWERDAARGLRDRGHDWGTVGDRISAFFGPAVWQVYLSPRKAATWSQRREYAALKEWQSGDLLIVRDADAKLGDPPKLLAVFEIDLSPSVDSCGLRPVFVDAAVTAFQSACHGGG